MKKVLISSIYGCNNIGDEAILYTIVQNLKRNFNDIQITVVTYQPEKTCKELNVRATHQHGKTQLLKHILATDFYICGGATILSDAPDHALKMILAAKLMLKPVMIYGVGMDPVHSSKMQFFIRHICNLVDLITVRDPDVKDRLIEYGVTKPPIFVAADPALSLNPSRGERKKEIIQKIGLHQIGRPRVGVGFTSIPKKGEHPSPPPQINKKAIAQVLDYLVERYASYICFTPTDTTPDQDPELLLEIKEIMRNSERTIMFLGDYSPADFLGLLSELDLVISSRLHLLILAASVNVPIIAISRSAKVDSFLKLLGQKPASSMADITFDKLKKVLDSFFDDKNNPLNDYQAKITEMKQKAKISEVLVQHWLNGNLKTFLGCNSLS